MALPTVLLADDQGEAGTSGAPNVAAVGLAAGGAAPSAVEVDPVLAEELTAVEPMYLASLPPSPELSPVEVAVGTTDDTLVARLMATYTDDVNGSDACWYNGIAGGQFISVHNPANGLSIECFTVLRDDGDPGLITLSPEAFVALADLTQAPVHVEIRQ